MAIIKARPSRDSNPEPCDSSLCQFPDSLDFTFTILIFINLGSGRQVSTLFT